jgi:hypothetical protein
MFKTMPWLFWSDSSTSVWPACGWKHYSMFGWIKPLLLVESRFIMICYRLCCNQQPWTVVYYTVTGCFVPSAQFTTLVLDCILLCCLPPFQTVNWSIKKLLNVVQYLEYLVVHNIAEPDPGSGILCLFDPWIREPGWIKNSFRIRDPDPRWTTRLIFSRS